MKKTLIIVATLLTTVCQAQNILGKWYMHNAKTQVLETEFNFFLSEGKYHGRITDLYNTAIDKHQMICENCSGSKKNQPFIGLIVLENFEKDKNDNYKGGTMTDPRSGRSYACSLRPDNNDSNTLVVKVYWGPFNKSVYLKRKPITP